MHFLKRIPLAALPSFAIRLFVSAAVLAEELPTASLARLYDYFSFVHQAMVRAAKGN